MKKEYLDVISDQLGVEPVFINSALVSAQNRQRYYWSNWAITQPEDRGIVLADIIDFNLEMKSISEGKIKRVLHSKFGVKKFITRDIDKCGTLVAGYYKQPSDGWYVLRDNREITMTSPIECERLQTVPRYIKQVEISSCLDQVKSFADVVERNPKLLKLVLSAENKELKEYVRFAIQNMNANPAPTKHIAHPSADMQIQTQTKTCTSSSQSAQSLTASSAENTTTSKQAGIEESFVTQSAFISITEGKITLFGKEELPQKDKRYTEPMNGKIALNLSGLETMQNAKDALSVLEMMQTNPHSISITSFRLSTKNIEQILIISYWFAKNAIDGFTQGTTTIGNLYLNLIDGYTAHVSNTQRYKCLGNGWTVDVIAHIFSHIEAKTVLVEKQLDLFEGEAA